MSYFGSKPHFYRCEHCAYEPGTYGSADCPFDCEMMAQGLIATPSMGNAVFYIPAEGDKHILKTPERKGWICPKCEAVVSPDEKTCPNCKPKKPKEESNGDGNKTHIQES